MISNPQPRGSDILSSRRIPRDRVWGLAFSIALSLVRIVHAASPAPPVPGNVPAPSADSIVVPGPTNAVQFRLYLDASPDAPHLFNTFEIEAYGEMLLRSPDADSLRRSLKARPGTAPIHNILVGGEGPRLDSSNRMSIIERASGPEWSYVALDVSAAYRGRLKEYRRAILFVEPDLFILHDHMVAERKSSFQMVLHPPAATQLDPVWGDLRLESTNAGFRIHAPDQRNDPRFWGRMDAGSEGTLPGTVAMQLGPTNQLAKLDLLTVYAIHKSGQKKDLAFKLLLSHTAVGARIHRDGLPTLAGFRLDPAEPKPSLTGFAWDGPVGVDVFKPKRRPGAR